MPPPIPYGKSDGEDVNWERGWASNRWRLTPAGVAAIQREIEEARKRRRDRWESWAKIIGGLLAALVPVLSLILAIIAARR